MRARLLAAVVVPVVAALLLTACGGTPVENAPPPAYDPPLGFAAPTGTLFGGSGTRVFGGDADLPAALVGTEVWATDGGRVLRADSTGTAIPGPTVPAGRFAAGAPVAAPDGSVLVGASSVVPGSGTTPPGLAVDLLAFDAASGALRWSAPTVLPWAERPPAVAMAVAGVVAGVAVLTASTDTQRTALGVDLGSQRVLWSADGVAVDAVLADGPAGGTALGIATAPGGSRAYADSTIVGLDAVTGLRRFAPPDVLRAPEITPAGPSLAVVSGRTAATTLSAPSASLRFVDARGATVRTVDVGRTYTPPRCVWDEAATTVCGGDTRIFAVDAGTAAPLWELPDPAANRVAPRMTTAWHGAVYGTTVNGPLVLDARTGADRDTRPGAAPVLVNAYLGLGAEAGGVAAFGGGATITPAIR